MTIHLLSIPWTEYVPLLSGPKTGHKNSLYGQTNLWCQKTHKRSPTPYLPNEGLNGKNKATLYAQTSNFACWGNLFSSHLDQVFGQISNYLDQERNIWSQISEVKLRLVVFYERELSKVWSASARCRFYLQSSQLQPIADSANVIFQYPSVNKILRCTALGPNGNFICLPACTQSILMWYRFGRDASITQNVLLTRVKMVLHVMKKKWRHNVV